MHPFREESQQKGRVRHAPLPAQLEKAPSKQVYPPSRLVNKGCEMEELVPVSPVGELYHPYQPGRLPIRIKLNFIA